MTETPDPRIDGRQPSECVRLRESNEELLAALGEMVLANSDLAEAADFEPRGGVSDYALAKAVRRMGTASTAARALLTNATTDHQPRKELK